MITRRGFLRTTLVAAGMQAGAPAHGSVRSLLAPPIHIIALAGCGEGELFCGALPQRAQRFSLDVGDVLQGLAAGGGADPGCTCLGLTRDSDHLLIRQILIERDSTEIYFGRHQFTRGGWRHDLHAPSTMIASLGRALAAPSAGWPAVVAAHASAIATSPDRREQRIFVSPASPAPTGPDCLVSWAYRLGAAPA